MGDVEMSEAEITGAAEEFNLSAVFDAHKSDVRALTITSSNEIITGGRDESVRFFVKRRGAFAEYGHIQQEKGQMVNALALMEQDGDSLLFVGLKNGSVAIYKNGATTPVVSHHYHKANVSCLYVDKKNMKLMSGSWDNTVIVWPIDRITEEQFPALQLNGHSLSVWALASLANKPGYYLSGSADKTIKMWEDDRCIATYNGHTDVVRALLMLNDDCFLSAANDFTLRMWHTATDTPIRVFKSLVEEYKYSLSRIGDYVMSTGEGGYLEIWKQTENKGEIDFVHSQMARIPTSSAWASAAISDKDVAIGGSDGKVYVYSTDPSKKAPEEVIAALNDTLAAQVAAEMARKDEEAQGEIVIKVSLDDGEPKLELRYKKGSDPAIAAENFIRANDLPISYLNEITEYIVANIPEARQAQQKKFHKQPTQRVEVDGQMYDYAMEVTLEGRTLKMPFNASDDPDMVAFKFVEKHNIPIKYAPKFAQLVKNDLGAKTSGPSSDFYDPFTGGGRYVPGQSGAGGSGGGADPFTGGGRYVPQSASTSTGSGSSGDPLTSGGRYIPGSADPNLVPNSCRPHDKLRPRGELVPVSDFYLFGVEGVSQKAFTTLQEVNTKQEGLQMNEEQLAAMQKLLCSKPGTIEVGDLEATAIETALQWPMENLGVVLDLFRIALLHEKLNTYFCDVKTRGSDTLLRLQALLVCSPPDAVRIFVCRSVANAFAHPAGCAMILKDMGSLLPLVAASFNTPKAPLQLAAASALANWSCLLLRHSETITELGPREEVLRIIIKELEPILSFGDKSEAAMIRMLQAIVTLMWGDRQVISLGKSRNIMAIVNRLKDAVVQDVGKHVARDIVEMTFAV